MNKSGVTALPFRPIRGGRIFEEVVDQIRDAIFSGAFTAGDKLPPERDLAAHFGVSRACVREALRVLELSGVVKVRHGGVGGVFIAENRVRPVGLALHTLLKHEQFTVPELFAAKIFFEERMAEEVARLATEEDLAALDENLARTEQTVERGETAHKEAMEFHLLMVRALKNRVLEEILGSIVALAQQVEAEYPGDQKFYRTVLLEHRQILAALRARNPRKAGRAMMRHLKTVETLYLTN